MLKTSFEERLAIFGRPPVSIEAADVAVRTRPVACPLRGLHSPGSAPQRICLPVRGHFYSLPSSLPAPGGPIRGEMLSRR